jgi:hypothetical protein
MLRPEFSDEQVGLKGEEPLIEKDRKYSEKGLCYNIF